MPQGNSHTSGAGWTTLSWILNEVSTSRFVQLAVVDPVTVLKFSRHTRTLVAFWRHLPSQVLQHFHALAFLVNVVLDSADGCTIGDVFEYNRNKSLLQSEYIMNKRIVSD